MNLEFKTIRAMVRLYCRAHHHPDSAGCSECSELLDYAGLRIQKCPFGMDKPACNKCTVHCYTPEMRDRVKAVMRYAGPRMLFLHPVLAFRHLIRSEHHSGKRSK